MITDDQIVEKIRDCFSGYGFTPEQLNKVIDTLTKGVKYSGELRDISAVLDFSRRIKEVTQLLNLNKEEYIKGPIRKNPELALQSAKTINDNVTGSALLLKMAKDHFVRLAMKHPPLFQQDPKTIFAHGELIKEFNKRGIITPDVQEIIEKKPLLLSLGNDNFELRLTYADHANIKNQKGFRLLTKNRKTIERDMVQLLGYDPDEKVISLDRVGDNNYMLLSEMVEDKRLKGYKLELAG